MAKVIYNNIIPSSGYQAMTILPFIFARKRFDPLADHTLYHERIHLRQQLEVLVTLFGVMSGLCLTLISWWWMILVPFGYYILYITEYLVRGIMYNDNKEGYRNISFEQEAFMNERDFEYLKRRRPFAWIKYLTKKTYRR